MKTNTLPLELIKLNAGTQSRLTIKQETVEDYAEILSELPVTEWPFPPLDVFFNGTDYLMSDGFHRHLGADKAGRASAPCVIHPGDVKDAIIFGMKANDKNGLRRSQGDKRANVEWVLDNCGKLPQKDVAEMAGVSERLVRLVVADRKPKLEPHQPPPQIDRQRAGLQPEVGNCESDETPDDIVPLRPKKGDKSKPEPKSITGKTGHESEVWQAQQVIKTWADAVGRWMSCHPSIDSYRNKFPGMAGDRVIEAAKELWTALDAWKKVLK